MSDLIRRLRSYKPHDWDEHVVTDCNEAADAITVARNEINALKHEIDRLLTLTSEQATEIVRLTGLYQCACAALGESTKKRFALDDEVERQATEIVGKDKEIERLEAKLQSERGDDALATMRLLEESDAQSVLLKKAETALGNLLGTFNPDGAPSEQDVDDALAEARAVLSELQLKGK